MSTSPSLPKSLLVDQINHKYPGSVLGKRKKTNSEEMKKVRSAAAQMIASGSTAYSSPSIQNENPRVVNASNLFNVKMGLIKAYKRGGLVEAQEYLVSNIKEKPNEVKAVKDLINDKARVIMDNNFEMIFSGDSQKEALIPFFEDLKSDVLANYIELKVYQSDPDEMMTDYLQEILKENNTPEYLEKLLSVSYYSLTNGSSTDESSYGIFKSLITEEELVAINLSTLNQTAYTSTSQSSSLNDL